MPWGAARYIFFGTSLSPFAATQLGGGELLLEAGVSTSTDWNDLETWAELNPDVLHRTVMYAQIINVAEPTDETEDFDLKRQIDEACARAPQAGGTGCGPEVSIYLPGGENYLGAVMVETGVHIHEALQTGDAVLGNWWNLTRGEVPAPPRTDWYDAALWQPNSCVGRAAGLSCDEFPFWSTEQRIDGSGMVASLRPVPTTETTPQGNDLAIGNTGGFCNLCDVGALDHFMVISPPRSYIGNAGPSIRGNSFGLKIDFTGAEPETTRCM